MPQRKKNQNKQNSKIIKKTTLQQINYTEQLRIPTITAYDSKQLGKSIQLRKSNSRKPASRKSRCISAKQPQPPFRLKDLLKQFNSLKLIQSKSKSPKSNKQTRSKKGSKGKLKKGATTHHTKFNTQLNSHNNSQVNLTAKLQRTIRKLKQNDYFKDDEDSDIPFVSTSSAFTPQEKQKLEIVENQNQDDINIKEMRFYSSTKLTRNNGRTLKIQKNCLGNQFLKRSIDTLKGNIYETMARKIQRAWRRYRTHKLISFYANQNFFASIIEAYNQKSQKQPQRENSSSSDSNEHSDLMIESQQFYPLEMQQRKITYISNLQEQSQQQHRKQIKLEYKQQSIDNQSNDVAVEQEPRDEQLKKIKEKQLLRWNQIVKQLGMCPNNPKQREQFINKLMSTIQNNKKQLISKQNNSKDGSPSQKEQKMQVNRNQLQYKANKQSYPKQQEQRQQQQYQQKIPQKHQSQRQDTYLDFSQHKKDIGNRYSRHIKKLSSHSEQSMKIIDEQFNSRKYIEYLDSDMYPREESQQKKEIAFLKKPQQNLKKISKKKQDLLLMKLNRDSVSVRNKQIYRGWLTDTNYENLLNLDGEIRSRLSYRSNSDFSNESSSAFQGNQQIYDQDRDHIHNEDKYCKNPRKKHDELRKSSSEKIFKILQISTDRYNQFKTIEYPQAQIQAHQQQLQQEQQLPNFEEQQPQLPQQSSNKQLEDHHFHSESEESENAEDMLNRFVKKQINQYDFMHDLGKEQDSQKFSRLHSEKQLARQLAELKKLRDEDSDLQYSGEQHQDIANNNKDQYSSLSPSKNEQKPSLSEQEEEPILHRTSDHPFQLHKINIEDYDHDIESDEEISSGCLEDNRIKLNRNGKIKQMSDIAEKAQGISEILFHHALIEVLKDMARYPTTVLKAFKQFAIQIKQTERKKQNSSGNKVKRAPQKAKKSGFPTNQAEIRTFSQELNKYLLNQQPHIFKNLERSTGPSAIEMLRYMHHSDDQEIVLDEEEDDPSVMVLPNWIFDVYWGRKSANLKYQRQSMLLDDQRQQQRQQYLKSLNKIFYRSLFDCFNECLDYQRNFGPVGKPFPWKRTAQFQHIKNFTQIQSSVKNAEKKFLQITSTYCGIIIEKEEMMTLCGSQEYLDQVQEDRLSRMLAQDLVEGQDRWIFYDDEETQLLVEISNTLYHEVLWEFINQLYLLDSIRV